MISLDSPGSAQEPSPRTTLVVYEPTAAGRTALLQAREIARSTATRLGVLVVVRRERTDIGCGRCRQGAVLWNRELGPIAEEQLADARSVIGSYPADYMVGEAPELGAITDAARRAGAGVIVVARRGGLAPRVLRRPGLVERLRSLGDWEVVTAGRAGDAGDTEQADGRAGIVAPV